jgi:hypothetical protein
MASGALNEVSGLQHCSGIVDKKVRGKVPAGLVSERGLVSLSPGSSPAALAGAVHGGGLALVLPGRVCAVSATGGGRQSPRHRSPMTAGGATPGYTGSRQSMVATHNGGVTASNSMSGGGVRVSPMQRGVAAGGGGFLVRPPRDSVSMQAYKHAAGALEELPMMSHSPRSARGGALGRVEHGTAVRHHHHQQQQQQKKRCGFVTGGGSRVCGISGREDTHGEEMGPPIAAGVSALVRRAVGDAKSPEARRILGLL